MKTSNVARVALVYDTRTFTRDLKPDVFTTVDYPKVLETVRTATHVVVGIEYGASASFTFDRVVKNTEDKRKVTGSMKASIRKIPGIEIEGGAEIAITEEEKEDLDQFSCKFHGDFVLKSQPGTYKEAVAVYNDLPSYLGPEYENSVPMKVWLYPIHALPINRASEVLHKIKDDLMLDVTKQFESLSKLDVMSNDILDSVVARFHERVRQKVTGFQENLNRFSMRMKQELARLLPSIRADGNEDALHKVLSDKEASPFAREHLEKWIDKVNQEVIVLKTTHRLPNYCRHDGDFSAFLLNNKKYTFALTLHLDDMNDPFVNEMSKYLKDPNDASASPSTEKNNWWTNPRLRADLQRKGCSFDSFSKIVQAMENEDFLKLNFQFVVREEAATDGVPSVTIKKYEYATMVDSDYEIPSATGIPRQSETAFDGITIAWDAPREGASNVHHYEVETYLVSDEMDENNRTESVMKKLQPFQTKGKVERMAVAGLKPERVYVFVVNTYCEHGKTAISKKSDYILTAKCPKGMYYSGDKCLQCSPGYFSDTEGATACEKCPVGSQSRTGSSHCQPCPKGTYIDDNQCLPCDPGSFSSVPGLTSCDKCPIGFYAESYGSDRCQKCPDGTVTILPGGKDVTDCGGGINNKMEKMLEKALEDLKAKDTSLQSQLESVHSQLNKFELRVDNSLDVFHPHEMILIQSHDFREPTSFASRTWEEYKTGFGAPFTKEYWLGLNELRRLITQKQFNVQYNIIFQVEWDKNEDGTPDSRKGLIGTMEIADFFIHDESDGFRLHFKDFVEETNWHGKYSSYRAQHRNRQFQTIDKKVDGETHCADPSSFTGGGGWWHGNCGSGNLNLNSNKKILRAGFWKVPAKSKIWLKKGEKRVLAS